MRIFIDINARRVCVEGKSEVLDSELILSSFKLGILESRE